jgi:hypothetical protein
MSGVCSRLLYMKWIVSSAYCRMKMASMRCGTRPLIYPFYLPPDIIVASISATKLNNKCDKGSLCLKPFFIWKYFPTWTLTFTPILPLLTNWFIQWHHFSEKPLVLNVCCKNCVTWVWPYWESNILVVTLLVFFLVTQQTWYVATTHNLFNTINVNHCQSFLATRML